MDTKPNSRKKTTRTAVDLGGLDDLGSLNFNDLAAQAPEAKLNAEGAARELKVGDTFTAKNEDVLEDPDNYRRQFDLTETIAITQKRIADGKRPFRVHLSVRKHPTIEGKWLLNNGARRKRTGVILNIDDLPCVWEEDYDSDDKFLVNVGEAGHTPLEWAYYIEDRLRHVSVKELAAIIVKSESFISKHRALLKMPDELLDIHDEKKCEDAEALYLMSKNWEKHKDDFLALAATLTVVDGKQEVIQQATVKAIIKAGKKEVTQAAPIAPQLQNSQQVAAQVQVSPIVDSGASGGGFSGGESSAALGGIDSSDVHEQGDNKEVVTPPVVVQVPPVDPVKNDPGKSNNKGSQEEEKYKKPAVQIKHDDRPAKLNLSKKTTYGLVWIKYDDDGSEKMIAVNDIELVAIVDLVGAA